VNLARLHQHFTAGGDGYEKLEHALPIEQLAPLQATVCAFERTAMFQAALVLVRFYEELAPLLARTHDLPYPADLAGVMSARLNNVRDTDVN
jgi:hypothetical protein